MIKPLWTPSDERIRTSRMTDFATWAAARTDRRFDSYKDLHEWSCSDVGRFWRLFQDYTQLLSTGSQEPPLVPGAMPGVTWFEGIRLNFAENILERGFSGPAIVYRIEPDERRSHDRGGFGGEISFQELRGLVARASRGLRAAGVRPGDRVAGFTANVPEAVVAALACAAVGATWSSASPDFALQAVTDRFGQVKPVLVFASTHYRYKGRTFETRRVVEQMKTAVPSIRQIVSIPYPVGNAPRMGDTDWETFLGPDDEPVLAYEQLPFAHPLYIMFSSGTTGAPKCMVHGAGGTLLQHRKEHQLHCDLGPGDRLLYFTTCGWMMWNWQLSALSVGSTIVCYDGSPAHPELTTLWEAVQETGTTHFGTSGRHIEASMKGLPDDAIASFGGLPETRTIMYTGSPLSEAGYEWVYQNVKRDVHLAGIAGGTDIISCFVLGNPTLPVYPGEIQCKGLGVDVQAFDESGRSVVGEPGELVCVQPMPSMPTKFLDDPGGERYRSAYFEKYPGIWRHGDFITITERGGIIIHGRSDATLNPGGVRIGSSELYGALHAVDAVTGAVAVGWIGPGRSDEQIVLLVSLVSGTTLDEQTVRAIRNAIRETCSPKHVPQHIFQVSEIPVTRSGKTVELSVKAILAGRNISNRNALANPEALTEIEEIRKILLASS
jgi:acetoacetyl-CoA synthetase